jgi:hypothetical protein
MARVLKLTAQGVIFFIVLALLVLPGHCRESRRKQSTAEYSECLTPTFNHPKYGLKKCYDYCDPVNATRLMITFCNNSCPGYKEKCDSLFFSNTPRPSTVHLVLKTSPETPSDQVLNVEEQVTDETTRSTSGQTKLHQHERSSLNASSNWMLILILPAVLLAICVISVVWIRVRCVRLCLSHRPRKPIQEVGPDATQPNGGGTNIHLLSSIQSNSLA